MDEKAVRLKALRLRDIQLQKKKLTAIPQAYRISSVFSDSSRKCGDSQNALVGFAVWYDLRSLKRLLLQLRLRAAELDRH